MKCSDGQASLRPILPALRERRSLRSFADAPLPDDVLASIFEAARWAPSAANGQPWRFVFARKGTAAFEALASTLKPGNSWAKRAPLLILTATRNHHQHPSKPPRPNHLALLELGLAIGNLLAQATALGVLVHPMAGFDSSLAAGALGIEDGYEVGVLLAVGYPGDGSELEPEVLAKDRRPRTRLPLAEIAFEESWVTPASIVHEARAPEPKQPKAEGGPESEPEGS